MLFISSTQHEQPTDLIQMCVHRRTGSNCIVLLLCLSLFSYIANLIIASVQIAHRGGLLIANQKFVNSRKTCKSQLLDSRN